MNNNVNATFFISLTWNDKPVSKHFQVLSNELARRNHTVVMLVDGQNVAVENRKSNPAVFTWPSRRPIYFRDAYFLYSLIRQYRPDCMIANFGATNLMVLLGSLMRVPNRVTWYRTLSTQINLDQQTPSLNLQLLRLRKRLIYHLATHIVTNSQAAKVDLQDVYKIPEQKSKVFYNSLTDPIVTSSGMGPPINSRKIICVGRHEFSKGQDVLITAMSVLRDLDLCVEFIGGGPASNGYAKLAEELNVDDRCIFTGTLSHDEVLRRMSEALLTIVPSRSEAFGWVNIESLSLGTPVVASNVGGISEIIVDEVNGFLVPPDDPKQLAEKIRLIYSNSELRHAMSINARTVFLNKFEQNKNLSKQVEWFEFLVKAKLDNSL